MILEFFRFELKQQLRAPLLWLMALMFGLFAFGAASSDAIQIGSAVGNIHRNAPTVIITFLGIFTVLGLLVIVSFISGALLRDFELGTADLFFSSPMRKRDFLIGRFAAALVACCVVYLMVALGLMLGPLMPWVDPERLGAFSLAPYVWGFGVLVLPNLLFTGALLALLAVTTRSLLAVYLGVIGFFVLYVMSGRLTADLDNVWLATLLDPFGITAFRRIVRYWSAAENNTQLPAVTGYLLANRALWVVIALGLVTATFALFKPQRTGTGKGWFAGWSARRARRRAGDAAPVVTARPGSMIAPRVLPASGASVAWSQFLRQWRFDSVGVFKSVPFLIMLALAVANFDGSASVVQSMFGTKVYPVTSLMLQALQGSFTFMLLIIVMFYAGELVWKERGAKIDEVTDALPVPNWVPLAAKMAALVLVVLVFQAVGALAAMAMQLAKGFTALEPALYLKASLLDSIPFVLIAGLALVLQVLSNNKFIGYGLLIAWLVVQGTLGYLDFDHNLYNYGSAPAAPYSDMNGYGHFLPARLWFQAYWGVCLLALLLVAAAFWVRGVSPSRRERFKLARQRLTSGHGLALAASLMVFALMGGFIFWNTNVRNEYVAGDAVQDRQQRYEEQYLPYKDLPQPRISAVSTQVDLRPEDQRVRIRGSYTINNPHATAINDIHIQLYPYTRLHALAFGEAELVSNDEPVNYRIYRLAEPMQPGEQRELSFDVEFGQEGFGNETAATELVENGSFINSRMLPGFGYNEGFQIADRNERRKRGMPESPRMPKLEDEAARANTYIGDDGDWIAFKTTVCTAPDQIALAPGLLQKEHQRDGRRCFDYTMQRPMLNFHATLSARWQVKKGAYKAGTADEIPIEVYYDAKHPYNVDRMIESVQKSLAYYEANFSPYQHQQVRILEFPGYSSFAQAFAGTIPYSESIGFIADLRDQEAIDYVFYVTAHEIAHQWWAHQVIGANVQGATMLSESLAQYSALMVMEHEYGRDKMRRFLKYELDRYLSSRGSEMIEELPLYRVENQQYIHYRKGSLAFYRLREEMGEEALNRALSKFVHDKGYQHAPFTTSAELLGYIRAEAGSDNQQLITDLFENITFYDNRVESVAARKRDDGKYEVTLKLHAAKRYADGKGEETVAPLDDWIEVGVFARGPSGKEADEKVLYLQRHHVTEDAPTLTVVVDEAPYEVGFDPYNKLIDRVSGDNRKRISL
ncbi:membrane protein [Lysobacter concretionis Ko07 = DSM 16239]|uniref:Membrane protein n=1 Tax=Lysobacter concretionis Ko07 = DSM 16239 TaxID=1122185 RepID=A0A0A0ERY7_9GAMM|nr:MULTISPECIES: M1 family aminopeptidase [Lysobacter]KGM51907.1 membrane protein [Lysobacter concretionis Ko07 = DSM 16239]QOD90353.1 ABC transporter permease subunit [Lysobacter sp. CW239]